MFDALKNFTIGKIDTFEDNTFILKCREANSNMTINLGIDTDLPLVSVSKVVERFTDSREELPVAYVFKPLSRFVKSGDKYLFVGTSSFKNLSLDQVRNARMSVELLYNFGSWLYFEYAKIGSVILVSPDEETVQFFDA